MSTARLDRFLLDVGSDAAADSFNIRRLHADWRCMAALRPRFLECE
jgi:hypothetical protein